MKKCLNIFQIRSRLGPGIRAAVQAGILEGGYWQMGQLQEPHGRTGQDVIFCCNHFWHNVIQFAVLTKTPFFISLCLKKEMNVLSD